MPEYRYPGVYVEEIAAGTTSIPGVSTSIGDSALESIASEFGRTMQSVVPEWTTENESDPGVTLVEIFAFLSESLLYRANQIPERGRSAASRAAAALAALGHPGERPCESLRRPSFFTGQLLDAGTLAAEQDYHREKLRRHNRAVLGSGVVSGLSIRVEAMPPSDGCRVIVEPGYAIDAEGEEISLPCPVALAAPPQGESVYVTLRFWEWPCSPVPTANGVSVAPSAIEEGCVVGVSADVVPPALPLGRLVRFEDCWQLDPGFQTPHARTGGHPGG